MSYRAEKAHFGAHLSINAPNDPEHHGPPTPFTTGLISTERLPRYTFMPNFVTLGQIFTSYRTDKLISYNRTDGWTDGQMDRRTDRRTHAGDDNIPSA